MREFLFPGGNYLFGSLRLLILAAAAFVVLWLFDLWTRHPKQGNAVRFLFVVLSLLGLMGYSGQKLVRTHLGVAISDSRYDFERPIRPMRGSIYSANKDGKGTSVPLVKSTQCWEFRLDPVAMTNATVRAKGEKRPRTREAMVRTIANCLNLDYATVLDMSKDSAHRYQLLAVSSSQRAHDILTNPRLMAGVIAKETHERHYFEGRRLAHVLGAVNKEDDGSCGLEQKFNRMLHGTPGVQRGKKDAHGREIKEKRNYEVPAIPGVDIYLTVNYQLQREAELALADGIEKYGAASGWCVILDVRTGDVLALVSHPDFDPKEFGKASDEAKINRVMAFTYEPGSVMKVITAASALDAKFTHPDTRYSTDRFDKRYYKLPGDGSHKWDPTMTVRDAIVHSSNIVIGKLGFDFGPKRLYAYMTKFGFGQRTGIELPGEEIGILRDPNKRMWDKATWSRAPIGQGISVTALQIASAYQAIANDGVRLPPRIVSRVLDSEGNDIRDALLGDSSPRASECRARVISAEASRQIRQMMLGVASPQGTARRAAIRGYSVAGKTGTAQKVRNGKYAPGLYRATFCGIVPSGVVKRNPSDALPAESRIVVLVSLDFEEKRPYHQGGNSAAPIFKRIAQGALRYLEVDYDRPDEVDQYGEDEFEQMMIDRVRKAAEEDPQWDGDVQWMVEP